MRAVVEGMWCDVTRGSDGIPISSFQIILTNLTSTNTSNDCHLSGNMPCNSYRHLQSAVCSLQLPAEARSTSVAHTPVRGSGLPFACPATTVIWVASFALLGFELTKRCLVSIGNTFQQGTPPHVANKCFEGAHAMSQSPYVRRRAAFLTLYHLNGIHGPSPEERASETVDSYPCYKALATLQ